MSQSIGMVGARYYRLSGRVDAARLAPALLGAVAGGLVAAAIYACLIMYIPVAGMVTFILTGGFGLAVGWATGRLLRWARCRNTAVGMVSGLGVATAAWLFSWLVWVYLLLLRFGADVGLLDLMLHPGDLWELILEINAKGVWSFKGSTPTGFMLWGLWALEVGLIVGIALYFVRMALKAAPFCEHCQRWGETRRLADMGYRDEHELRRRLENGEFSCLAELGLASDPRMWYRVYFQGCAACDTTQTLCVDLVHMTQDKHGKTQEKVTPVIVRLLLTPEQTVEVAQVVGGLAAPQAEAGAKNEAGSKGKDTDQGGSAA